MTRPTSNSTKLRRMRSRLRERLDGLARTKNRLPIRQERQTAPQVRLLESRFVLDASAALIGLDALNSGLEVESCRNTTAMAPYGAELLHLRHPCLSSVEVSVPGLVSSAGATRQETTLSSGRFPAVSTALGQRCLGSLGLHLNSSAHRVVGYHWFENGKHRWRLGENLSSSENFGKVEPSREARFKQQMRRPPT